ncbi:hypothetical protein EDB85DRAFT_692289 [Lactarius pseudohatsudake]|nr:hypothetical protein EDB85DRAFT_692289 [Lactarius pseudohatsudake]
MDPHQDLPYLSFLRTAWFFFFNTSTLTVHIDRRRPSQRKHEKKNEKFSRMNGSSWIISRYYKSFMHHNVINFVVVTRMDTIVTTYVDSHLKLWEKDRKRA